MKQVITNYIKAGYPGLFVTSYEEARVEAVVRDSIESLNKASPDPYTLYVWSCTEGLVNTVTGKSVKVDGEEATNPMLALHAMIAAEAPAIFVMRDFHMYVEQRDPRLTRKIKDMLTVGKEQGKHLIILGCRLTMMPELEKELAVIEFKLPNKEQLNVELDQVLGSVKMTVTPEERAEILQASKGLTTTEAQNAYAISIVEKKRVCPKIVYREKCQTVKKNGILEVENTTLTLDDIGGLENIKRDLIEKKDVFTEAGIAYGLSGDQEPRGYMALGQPGCGKTMISKACGNLFNVPSLRLDGARLFDSLVGGTERNWRAAHATALAMAPCVLHISEIDGTTAGSGSSGQTDGGTTARVIKSILQDMEENSPGIFFVLTANDVDSLPSPLLRRVDSVWSFELPHAGERAVIWGIQIKKVGRKPENFDLPALAAKSEGYSGAEIAKVVKKSLYKGFAQKREPNQEDLLEIISRFIPLSKTMAADIEKRRKRLEGVAEPASTPPADTPTPKAGPRKIVTKKFEG